MAFLGAFSNIFGAKDKSHGSLIAESSDYVFAFEDETSRAVAKAALSFAPYSDITSPNKKIKDIDSKNLYIFDYQSAFEYAGYTETVTDGNESDKYRTIFTYSEFPVPDPLLTDFQNETRTRPGWATSGVAFILYCFSSLLLVALFPVLCWVFVKRVPKDERLVVFRLGKRLKLKGPGLVFLLPFCDQFCSVRLDEQTLEIGPVSGGTEDEALVEVKFSVSYRITDPEYVCTTVKETPAKLVLKEAQLCLLSSLSHLPWTCLDHGGAAHNLTTSTASSLNFRCSSYGVQVTDVQIRDVRLVRSPPSPEQLQKRRISTVQKQLHAITSALFQNTSTVVSATEEQPQCSVSDPPTDKSEGKCDTGVNCSVKSDTLVHEPKLPVSPASPVPLHMDVCSRAIERARPLLRNSLVCKVLGHKRMQVVVSAFKLTVPLPSLAEAEKSGDYALFYLDSHAGHAELGSFPGPESPDVTLYLCASDLSDALRGRLDLLDAMHRKTVFVTGTEEVFDKLRHLLHF